MHPALYNKYNLYLPLRYCNFHISEAIVRSCSVKKVFLKFCRIHRCFLWHRSFLWSLRNFKEHIFFAEHLQWLLLAFTPIEISYSITICNKSAAEAWICLLSFYGGAKDFIFTCIFPKIITPFIKIKMWHLFLVFLPLDQNLWFLKNDHTFLMQLLIILKTCSLFTS